MRLPEQKLEDRVDKTSNAFKRQVSAASGLGGGLTKLHGIVATLGSAYALHLGINAVREWTKLADVQDRAERSLRQAMVSMGRYSQEYETQVQGLASAIQSYTTYGDEAILEATRFLMTYRDISDEMMPRTMRAMADLAAFQGGSLVNAANMLGKAAMVWGQSCVGSASQSMKPLQNPAISTRYSHKSRNRWRSGKGHSRNTWRIVYVAWKHDRGYQGKTGQRISRLSAFRRGCKRCVRGIGY